MKVQTSQTSQAHEKRAMARDALTGNVTDLTQSDSESGESNTEELVDRSVNADTDVRDASIPHIRLESILSRPNEASSRHVPGTAPSFAGQPGDMEDSTSGRKALLTPLPTVLKSDRLGIGLKAKTVGPYKASRKRVTHNASALAAHIRAAEELKKEKGEFGRGRRGFQRQYRKDSMKRQMMLAYLNS